MKRPALVYAWGSFVIIKKALSEFGRTYPVILPSSLPKTTTFLTSFLQNGNSGHLLAGNCCLPCLGLFCPGLSRSVGPVLKGRGVPFQKKEI
jgi:hypothetical protein